MFFLYTSNRYIYNVLVKSDTKIMFINQKNIYKDITSNINGSNNVKICKHDFYFFISFKFILKLIGYFQQ